MSQFKHLLYGTFFRFPDGGMGPYVKVGPRTYVSALAPNKSSKYTHRIAPSTEVTQVESYPTHAFPSPRTDPSRGARKKRTCTWEVANYPALKICGKPTAPGFVFCRGHVQDSKDLYPHLAVPKHRAVRRDASRSSRPYGSAAAARALRAAGIPDADRRAEALLRGGLSASEVEFRASVGDLRGLGVARGDPRSTRSPRCPVGTVMQSVMLPAASFSRASAAAWLREHGKRPTKSLHRTANFWRARLLEPSSLTTLRTIRLGRGIEAVVGCPKKRRTR